MRWAGQVARKVKCRTALKIVTCKPTGKRHFRRPRRGWKDNIIMVLKEMGVSTRNWIDSTQDKDYWRVLVNAALNLRVT